MLKARTNLENKSRGPSCFSISGMIAKKQELGFMQKLETQ